MNAPLHRFAARRPCRRSPAGSSRGERRDRVWRGSSVPREFMLLTPSLIGVIDIPRTKDWPITGGAPDGKISPDAIADSYWYLHTQPRSHFTQELDVRPDVEKF
ncbi:short chain dehydrogenase reductase [Diplocarpon rosae]|nr:short chain dehydrogenase reductase [Diplocarpon rosae]